MDPPCLSTLISGGFLQMTPWFSGLAWFQGKKRELDIVPQWEACCPYPFLTGSLYWSYEPQCQPTPMTWGHLHPPHRECPEAPTAGS